VPAPPVALYIHVPFCLSICPYCDFVVVAGAAARGPRARIEAFVVALKTEIELRADDLDRRWGPPGSGGRPPLGSIYFGGGTPSLLPAAVVGDLIGLVAERFGLEADAEVTLEANPGPGERGDAAAWRAAGVSRTSFGAQSLSSAELRRLGRRHRSADVADAVADARGAGIASISLDLLYDIPGQSLDSWQATLDGALEIEPDHVSLYALTLDDPDVEGITGPLGDHLPTRRGARQWRRRAVAEQDEDRAAAMYEHAVDRLEADGWRDYEISNWARPGHECRHNLVYWERRPYEAVGPGAHSFDGRTRRWNAARLDGYIAALTPANGTPPGLPPGGVDVLEATAAASEAIILGLRTDRGVSRAAGRRPPLDRELDWAVAAKLVALTNDDRIVLTTRGRLLSNELFVRLV